MDKFTYQDATAGIKGTVIVRLGGKRTGIIVKRPTGWHYRAQGLARHSGEEFSTLDACKASVEAE